MDPKSLAPGTVTRTTSGTIYQGESATRLYQARIVMRGLELEMKTGMRMSAKFSTATVARQLTGSTARNKSVLLEAMQKLVAELETRVTVRSE